MAAQPTLHEAARTGNLALLEQLVAQGTEIDATDELGWTALHEAAAKGHAHVVERLLALGAWTDARDAQGRAPLHLAAILGHADVVAVLMKHGADPTARDAGGDTALDLVERHPDRRVWFGKGGAAPRRARARRELDKIAALLEGVPGRSAADESFDTAFATEAREPADEVQTSGVKKAPAAPQPSSPPLQTSSTRKAHRAAAPSVADRLAQARATERGVFGLLERWRRDSVDCTVFAPPEVRAGDEFLVQVFAHVPRQARAAAAAAREFNGEAERRGTTSLGTRVRRGSTLTFELDLPSFRVDDPVRELVWRGALASVEFGVDVPGRSPKQAVVGTVLVSQDSVPVGEVRFKVGFCRRPGPPGAGEPTGEARRYRRAFISYASQDRDRVLDRVAMLPAVGVRYFQDVFDLEPGDRWLARIRDWIDRSDVFLLFWSSHAKESEWVETEWRYALERKGEGFIRPIVIDAPPIPEPPPELAHLHFGDRTRYFLRQSG